MPSFGDWLIASWEDYRRVWGRLMAVIGAAGAASLAAAAFPMAVAAVLAFLRVGPPWLVLGGGFLAALCAAFWMSTWGQAAALRAARFDESASESLSRAWAQTTSFGWVVTLTCLAVGGAFALFVIPGLFLSGLLFFAPYYEVSGEAAGVEALGLSWARVSARPGPAALRLLTAGLLAWLPGLVPVIGWLLAMLWAPFGLVATSRLAEDLRAASPDARPPSWLAGLVAALSAFLIVALAAASLALGVWLPRALPRMSSLASGAMASGMDPAAGQALLAVLNGDATSDQKRRAYAFAVTASSAAWSAVSSTAAPAGTAP